MSTPPLGWIEPSLRTKEQDDAHSVAMASVMRNLALPPVVTAGPVKVMLTDFWKDPEVVADIGFEFTGFRQLTGSCVGVSAGNAIFTLGAIQRQLSENPTRAFVPWWPYDYGTTRYKEGDRGKGEGAVDSVMGVTLIKHGVFAATEPGLPQFDTSDGLALTSSQELQWSDGGSQTVKKWDSVAKLHPLGAAASLFSTQDIKTAILNGYPVLYGCEWYVGNGKIRGTGDNAYVVGKFDGRGGHSTCILGYWDHPVDGPLFLESNQWDRSTYPKDPAGAGRCCVWMPEKETARIFTLGGDQGETMALSSLNWFPAQPDVIDWSTI